MKKLSVLVPALALAVMMSASALAENGTVSEATMQEMGLGGMQVVSDQEAMAVRGKGFTSTFGRSRSSISIGAGFNSFFVGPFASVNFDTSSSDGFRAGGRFLSGGEHVSFSDFATSISRSVESPTGTVTRTTSLLISIGSGGSASAFSL